MRFLSWVICPFGPIGVSFQPVSPEKGREHGRRNEEDRCTIAKQSPAAWPGKVTLGDISHMELFNRAGRLDYLGLLLTSLATLMLELLLTRIFSVTLWYHLAFIAISLAMFGMTLGAMLVYLRRKRFGPQHAWFNLTWSTAAFSTTSVLSVVLILRIPL